MGASRIFTRCKWWIFKGESTWLCWRNRESGLPSVQLPRCKYPNDSSVLTVVWCIRMLLWLMYYQCHVKWIVYIEQILTSVQLFISPLWNIFYICKKNYSQLWPNHPRLARRLVVDLLLHPQGMSLQSLPVRIAIHAFILRTGRRTKYGHNEWKNSSRLFCKEDKTGPCVY